MTQCSHLSQVKDVHSDLDVCQDCVEQGDSWVHLRMCMSCGYVGCCDESKNTHAARHFAATEHPIVKSAEPDEEWMWCFVDKVFLGARDYQVGKEFLRNVPLFSGLSDEHIDHLFRMAEPIYVPAGRTFIREGDEGDSLFILLDGEAEVTKRLEGQDVVLAKRGPGEFVGEMAVINRSPRSASVRAIMDSHLLVVSHTAFKTLLNYDSSVPLGILAAMITRMESDRALLLQREKMAALGTLSAGLAHELNNPAAAIRRSASHLEEILGEWEDVSGRLGELGLTPEQATCLKTLQQEVAAQRGSRPESDPIARADMEDAIQDWLDAHNVPDSWEVGPALAAAGWDESKLDGLGGAFSDQQLPVLLRWSAARASAYDLLGEVRMASESISQIVGAVKTYSHLDEAPIQQVDIHQSLENTLIILKHKLKYGVTVVRDFGTDIPQIEAYGSELNQVWTNLIDNAVDAMGGEGEIVLRTRRADGSVVVEIQDSGPGIPPNILDRIYDPFFTTKPPGEGSGLGLHIAYNIVVEKHRGRLEVDSEPGKTVFRVTLPERVTRE